MFEVAFFIANDKQLCMNTALYFAIDVASHYFFFFSAWCKGNVDLEGFLV